MEKEKMIIRDKYGKFVKGSSKLLKDRKKVYCSNCNNILFRLWSHIKNNKKIFCNTKCKAEWQKENLKGNNNPFYNKKHSKEVIESIRKQAKKRYAMPEDNPFFGRKHTKESILKMSLTTEILYKEGIVKKRYGDLNSSKRPEVRVKIRAARMKQKLPFRNTSIEIKLFAELKSRNILFQKHKSVLGRTQPDAFIEPNVCIYADGDYWHNREDTKEKDIRINELLNKKGYKVLRYWEHEINDNTEGCVDEIEEVLLCHNNILAYT